MREKNRKPIEEMAEFPQFTTMHVIEGQAGQTIYASLNFYSLTIDNILNIIVMLILVTVTIRVATDGNLFTHAANAVKGTKTAIVGENAILNDELDKSIEDIVAEATGNITYTAYTVGQTVRIAGQEFYVIENSDASTSTVKLLAKYNVDTGTNKQSASAGTVAFDSTSSYTDDYDAETDPPTIKGFVNSYVLSLGVIVQEGRLMLKNEADALRTGHTNILYATNYWLGSSIGPDEAAYIVGDGSPVDNGSVEQDGIFGLRPVIVILKSNIPAQ